MTTVLANKVSLQGGMTSLLRIVNKSNKEYYYPLTDPLNKSRKQILYQTHIEEDLRAYTQTQKNTSLLENLSIMKEMRISFLGLLTAFEVNEKNLNIRIQSWEYGIVYSIYSECTLCRSA